MSFEGREWSRTIAISQISFVPLIFTSLNDTSTKNAYVRCLKSIYIPSLWTIKFYIYLYNRAYYLFFIYVFSFVYLLCYFSNRCKLKSSTTMVHKSFRLCLYNSKMVANAIENCGHYTFLVDHIF